MHASGPSPAYDAVLLVSFGGPEKPEDVAPFLENVLRGANVPRERMLAVASHYDYFGGVSPSGEQIRALLAALVAELNALGPRLPVYWGTRNWHPLLGDTLAQMAGDRVTRALALVTSAFGSYSGCRRYLEDIENARQAVGESAPQVDKLRLFYNHPGFIEAMGDRVAAALAELPEDRRGTAQLVYTAHSIPQTMADGCDYQQQLQETCRLVSETLGRDDWRLVYQSRSGPPSRPWLGPDVCDELRRMAEEGGVRDVVVVPAGFLSDHVEVVYDLDVKAQQVCEDILLLNTLVIRAFTPHLNGHAQSILSQKKPMCPGQKRSGMTRYALFCFTTGAQHT